MLKNYLKITWRSLLRQKAFSLINIIGLAIGMASAALILFWVQNEFSYDQLMVIMPIIFLIPCNVSV